MQNTYNFEQKKIGREIEGKLTRDPHVGRTAGHHLPTQPMHGATSVRGKLIAKLQIVNEKIARGQLMKLSVCNTTNTLQTTLLPPRALFPPFSLPPRPATPANQNLINPT